MSKLSEEAAEFIRTAKKSAAKTKGERVFESSTGRQLQDFETVLYKDGNSNNLSPENLILGLRAGIDYRMLTCRNCGCRVMGIDSLPVPQNLDS